MKTSAITGTISLHTVRKILKFSNVFLLPEDEKRNQHHNQKKWFRPFHGEIIFL